VSDLTSIAGAPPGIALWWCDLDARAARATSLAQTLSAAERERAARFGTAALRDRWIAGRTALRDLLADVLGTSPADVPLRRGRRGRPELAIAGAPDFNVSHTRGAAVIAIGSRVEPGVRIGVDVERADRAVDMDRLARKFLAPRERSAIAALDPDARRARFLRLWTFKEAMSKATADGLIAPFRELDVECDPPRLVAGPGRYSPSQWRLFAPGVATDYFAALALWRIDAASAAALAPL
jgi:4'-phosphopantetheinyl transferase